MTTRKRGLRPGERDDVLILDPTKVRVRRIEAGLSELEVGSTLGLAIGVIRGLERGRDQCYLNLRLVRDLADVLGVNAADLLLHGTTQTSACGASVDIVDENDVVAVGALLAETQEMLAVDTIAWSLGWTSARTLVALDQLEAQLAMVGQRLRWLHDSMVGICAERPNDEVLAATARRGVAEDGLAPREASVLATVLERGQVRVRDVPNMTLRRLVRSGHLETTTVDEPVDPTGTTRNFEGARLTEFARYNLVLD